MRAPQQVPAPVARGQPDGAGQQQHGAGDHGQLRCQRRTQHAVRQVADQPPEAGRQRLHQPHTRWRDIERAVRQQARAGRHIVDAGRCCRPVAWRYIDDLAGWIEQRQQRRIIRALQFGEERLEGHAGGHQHGGRVAGIGGAGQHHDRGVIHRVAQRTHPDLLVARRHGVAAALQQRLGQPCAQPRDQRRVERERCARAGLGLADDHGAVFVQRDRVGPVVEIERLLRGHRSQGNLPQPHELRRQPGPPALPRCLGGKQVIVLAHGIDVETRGAGAPEGPEGGIARRLRCGRIEVVANAQHGAPQERGLVMQQLRDRTGVPRDVAAAVVKVLFRCQAGKQQAGEQHDGDQHRDGHRIQVLLAARVVGKRIEGAGQGLTGTVDGLLHRRVRPCQIRRFS
ncbi:hypothetical protein D9M72_411960 [compost metagenome]